MPCEPVDFARFAFAFRTGRLQKNGQNIPINATMVEIETRINSYELAHCGAESAGDCRSLLWWVIRYEQRRR